MNNGNLAKHMVIGVSLFLGVCWSLGAAGQEERERRDAYPNARFLATAGWLREHAERADVVVVDVREDKYFDGEVIPGAVRLPWRAFRRNNTALHVGSVFVGVEQAQKILGDHGIQPGDTVVLVDSVERDGGATASYLFWLLDMLGHENMKILEGGIDAWKQAGGETAPPAAPEPVLYQADPAAIHPRLWADGEYIHKRLADPYYQIIDVRSREEYLGEVGNKDLNGNPLKLGHIPTAFNIPYDAAWIDPETKHIKPYSELRDLYRGIDPDRAVVVYCHSGRRSSFSYFILRLMGFEDVIEYEGSWNEWGSPRNFFPVELQENRPAGDARPGASSDAPSTRATTGAAPKTGGAKQGAAAGGYVSCGG